MVEKDYKVIDYAGIHARPASLLVQVANQYNCDIDIMFNNRKANLKSIIGVMSLAIPLNSVIKICASGSDENEAIDALSDIILQQELGV
ncbi:HPr family phosphocarrier protein [Cytobacillus solani]|uniref:Phosphocarrier protein HPr n=1 Tax=Cytobacillus solani TaxID=1637975 RepID=A0A0Q3VI06_9BACI|nr:HPr family phosphocarrier protein [Cytobacillus solani]KOP83090.1 phosphocarrier protein HPr [Bacillus sp. FJAT-21945]KQL20114.1 phosphocarrier protein HPr [Cytobacillus solani]USK53366.1 HPr family phosphocarrier protein [Cytobacillus solani]